MIDLEIDKLSDIHKIKPGQIASYTGDFPGLIVRSLDPMDFKAYNVVLHDSNIQKLSKVKCE